MYSVYFSGAQARASSRRSSCLRSSNRSVRKSFPSQVNRSNAKKHGGLRRNSIFLNCGFPFLSRQTISPSSTVNFVFGTEAATCFPSSANEENGCPLRESKRPKREL